MQLIKPTTIIEFIPRAAIVTGARAVKYRTVSPSTDKISYLAPFCAPVSHQIAVADRSYNLTKETLILHAMYSSRKL